jgi:two-component system cell cycle response regulator
MEDTNTRVTASPAPHTEAQRIYLMAIAGANVGVVHKVGGTRAVLGRAASAQIRVEDDGISREHAEIVFENGHVTVRDLSSTNGTFVNGTRTVSARMRDGDQLSVGNATFVVFTHDDGAGRQLARVVPRTATTTRSANREAFVARISEELSFARRHGEMIAVLVWELVDYAAIEARLGPSGTRALLDALRASCSAVLRPGDLLAPLGEGRFASLLRRSTVAEGGALALKLRDAAALTSTDKTDKGGALALRVGVVGPAAGGGKPAGPAATLMLLAAEAALATAHERGAVVVEAT